MTLGGLTRDAMQSLQGNPLCIAVVLLVVVTNVFSYFYAAAVIEARGRAIEKLIEHCVPMSLAP